MSNGYDGPKAGPVRITKADGSQKIQPAYSDEEVAAIVRQGRERPRPLTHDETIRAANNRRISREDSLAMEYWHLVTSVGTRDSKTRGFELWEQQHPGVSTDKYSGN